MKKLGDVPDFDPNLRSEIVNLNGVYEKLFDEAKSLGDKDALNFLDFYKDSRRELIQ